MAETQTGWRKGAVALLYVLGAAFIEEYLFQESLRIAKVRCKASERKLTADT